MNAPIQWWNTDLAEVFGMSCCYLYCDNEYVQGIGFLRGGKRLSLTLQFGYLHPLPIKKGIEAVHLPYSYEQHIAMAIFDGLIVDSAQVVGAKQVLLGKG